MPLNCHTTNQTQRNMKLCSLSLCLQIASHYKSNPGLLYLFAYSLQPIDINPSFCWLFVIFLAIDIFSRLPLLYEWVDDAHAIVQIHIRWSALQMAYLQTEPVIQACKSHEMTSPVSHLYCSSTLFDRPHHHQLHRATKPPLL